MLPDFILHGSRCKLKRIDPEVHISVEEIADALKHEVLMCEAIKAEKAAAARQLIARAASKAPRKRKSKNNAKYYGVFALNDQKLVDDTNTKSPSFS